MTNRRYEVKVLRKRKAARTVLVTDSEFEARAEYVKRSAKQAKGETVVLVKSAVI